MSPSTAVVLLSGGLDSCVTAAVAREEHDLALLHVNYGQRTGTRELRAFEQIADHYAVEHRLSVDVGHLELIGGSSLVDTSMQVPTADDDSTVPTTYVPFRNGNLLAIAVSWAETMRAPAVYIGAHEQESVYPDCSAAFFEAFGATVSAGTALKPAIAIKTPLLTLDKGEIVRLGRALGAPLHLTWSCYQSLDRPCGCCHSCELRKRGFDAAGIRDPLTTPTAKVPDAG